MIAASRPRTDPILRPPQLDPDIPAGGQPRTKRLLLINPRFPESFWSFRWALDRVLPRYRTLNPPLGLATLAALTPSHWQIRIVDENVEPLPLDPEADVVGICGMGVQFPRQRELLDYFRQRGYYTVAGGSYASLCPEKYAAHADAVVAGEAEYIWPQFCRDFEAGTPASLYRESGVVKLEDSPTPRFDLLRLDRYSTATLQFSRGCPYRCEFCDIIVMFGRKPRFKSLPQVERELDALRRAGIHKVFFVDDNLIGNRPAAKTLLRFLADYQTRHGWRFSFGTEASINLAQDPELLDLLRDAGFGWIFIGIETADPATLKATGKTQNLHEDTLASVQRIYGHGIDVIAGFIVGFDNDTLETFEQQYRFITHSGIQVAMVGLLTALPRTPLYERLLAQGRIDTSAEDADNTRLGTNVAPLRMTRDAMISSYENLYRRLLTDAAIAARIRSKLQHMGKPVYRGGYGPGEALGIVLRLVARGIVPGGVARWWHFLRTLPWRRPDRLPLVISDWIAGLSMRAYVDRRFATATEQGRTLDRHLAKIRSALTTYVAAGTVSLRLGRTAAPTLSLDLTALLDPDFFRRAARPLERLLARTRARVMLRIDSFDPEQSEPLQRLLRRLARYGDRVAIAVEAHLHAVVPIDSSVFDLVLADRR